MNPTAPIRVAILISGGGSNMEKLVASMVGDHPARAVVVGANSATAGGLTKAATLGIKTFFVDHRAYDSRTDFEEALHAQLIQHAPDIICLAGFMRVLSAAFVERWQGKILNIHPSLLPKYKGLNTHARALAAGDQSGGCSVHLVTPALDDGPILGQVEVPILAGDTVDDLGTRVLVQEHLLYPAILRKFVSRQFDQV